MTPLQVCEQCNGRGGKFIIGRGGRRRWHPCKCACTAAETKAVVSILRHAQRRDDRPFALPDPHQIAMPVNDQKGEPMARRTPDDDREPRRRTATATETRRNSPNGRARGSRREEYSEEPGWGSLFHRPDNEGNQPAYTGQGLDIDGNPIELAIWVRKSRNGKKYLRIHIQEPYEADDAGGDQEDEHERPRASRSRSRARDDDRPEEDGADYDDGDDEDDVPF